MVFSSISFLFYFLPITLLIYNIVPKKLRNTILLIASLFFYFYGEPKYITVLLFSIIFNYYSSKIIVNISNKITKKLLLISNLVINFGILIYFKYFNFIIDNLNMIFNLDINLYKIVLPIGISFFTFQATSYVIDIYNNKVKCANSLKDFATYLSLFPQLIAGPIVRYETVSEELINRKNNLELFSLGTKRFIIGLSKKVLIANVLGELVNVLGGINEQSLISFWIIAVSATLQLYFDFSGYSDMAIGLGKMFGFNFLENFNYPLSATNITDFWRRWHISLSSWFKDYIYIPLGGSRCKKIINYRNILIVWITTGLWHGASWNFIIWGLYYGILLIIEKRFLLNFMNKHKIIGHLYTFILVTISFVIFNNDNLFNGLNFIQNMFNINNKIINSETWYYLKSYGVLLIIALVLSFPNYKLLFKKIHYKILDILEIIIYLILFVLCIAFIVDESFNPFLYFRF